MGNWETEMRREKERQAEVGGERMTRGGRMASENRGRGQAEASASIEPPRETQQF